METKTDQQIAKEISDRIVKVVTEFQAKFHCQKCGKCCESGVGVAMWPHEFHRLKKLDKHIYKHIVMIGNWYALRLPCVFYNSKKHRCKIYEKRPIACRMYPLGVSPDGSAKVSPNCPGAQKTTAEV